jgi:signal peptidase
MKYLTFALNTLLTVVLLGVAALLIAPHVGFGHFEIKIVRSGSMSPAIPTGSLVLIQPASTYDVGEVITFGADTPMSVPTSHRIISERTADGTTYFTTKGDANKTADPNEAPANKVIGRIVFSAPGLGYVLAFSKTKIGFELLVLTPSALVILYECIGIVNEVRAMKKRKRDERSIARLASESRVARTPFRQPAPARSQSQSLHFDIESPLVI